MSSSLEFFSIAATLACLLLILSCLVLYINIDTLWRTFRELDSRRRTLSYLIVIAFFAGLGLAYQHQQFWVTLIIIFISIPPIRLGYVLRKESAYSACYVAMVGVATLPAAIPVMFYANTFLSQN